ncbi:MAG: hypothetical protein B7Y36_00540 [Novosphingobium sp. 28-62-57]|uniref:DUF1499 domain-containing protein n=1 Tax=unclassified Novosphingobium TaxID=2644732 RepID=UPI000BC6D144|nr:MULTISPECIES: DUF1499 domain-containing protein [unclassified Novosphingobium]OYW49927.1 MAG: hypothetical protein B7Z34_06550 [Novosphingobium sp. 12-62-10]OYZ12081.1 MAG: hypothetical protein B7Y36_00540 [Novosphingobium sp. 28-62-57]OZA36729.1 MAG: hypothetical protein B7X92_05630 [Novosphingobium sp. 17-62-9]HQS68684.1 DUF1499 domain-containing protein [Novosphingobium sp.]
MNLNNPDIVKRAGRATGLARWSMRIAIASVAIAAIGLTLARYDVIAKMAGFSALLGGALVALVALLIGLWALFAGRGAVWPARTKAWAAVAISLVYVGFLASRPLVAGDGPAIHDLTTDLATPPQFEVLPLRADNLVGVDTVENWQRIHGQAYPDLGPVTIAKPVAAVTADAVRLAEAAGWDVAKADPARGHVEATASVSYIRFKDDVVLRIVPTPDGKGSRVDMRSVNRVGVGDLGVNARRIREFLAALAAA